MNGERGIVQFLVGRVSTTCMDRTVSPNDLVRNFQLIALNPLLSSSSWTSYLTDAEPWGQCQIVFGGLPWKTD